MSRLKLTGKRLIALVRAAVFDLGCDESLFEGLDESGVSKLYSLADRQDSAHLLSCGAAFLGVPLSGECAKKIDANRMIAVYRNIKMRFELDSIIRTFEEAGIDHLPLKGSVIRPMYPEEWMRTSCDIDILIKEQTLDRAIEVLCRELEYECGGKNNHDVQLTSPSGVTFELHYKPLNSYSVEGYDEPLRDLWDKLVLSEGYEHKYEMPPEYFYYYHIAHMAKHYVLGGCGIRSLVDIQIIKNKYPDIGERSEELLSLGGLAAFEKQASHLASVWFSDAEHTELTSDMENYVIFSGLYGDTENRIAVVRAKGGGRLHYILSRAFPSYEVLCDIYPSLVGKKILTPIYTVRRWFRILFHPTYIKRSVNEIKKNNALSEEKRKRIASMMDELGLKI